MRISTAAARVGAGFLSLLGVIFLVPNAGRLVDPSGSLAGLVLAGLGVVLSLVVVGAGGFLVWRGFTPTHTLRIVGWAALGNVVLGLVVGLAVLSGTTFPQYLTATILAVSTFAHVLIGIRDVQRIRAEDVARQREKLAVLNRLVRHNLRHESQRLVFVSSKLPGAAAETQRAELATTLDGVVGRLTDMNEKLSRSRRILNQDAPTTGVDLAATAETVVAEYRESHPGATFETDIGADCWVEGGEHLEYALSELVENAVVHSEGSATVTVETAVDDGWGTVRVSDDGPGIPEPDRSVITRELDISQLAHSQGLGLWFVRWVMDAYDGRFRLDSSNEGTTVELQLPRTAGTTA